MQDSIEGATEEEMVQTKAELLEELQDIVENVDRARDLKAIGGLPVLLSLITCKHQPLRWRAAEVLAVVVQNNIQVQEWALEGNCLPPLLTLCEDSDSLCTTKAVLALSSLVQNFSAGSQALKQANGHQVVGRLASSSDTKTSTKALRLMKVLCDDVSSCQRAINVGALQSVLSSLKSEDDASREAALELMHAISTHVALLPTNEHVLQIQVSIQERLKFIR